jgi:hypothetical protein
MNQGWHTQEGIPALGKAFEKLRMIRRSAGSGLEIARRRAFQHRPVGREPGAVQRAVPRPLEIVEANDAAEVSADCRKGAGLASNG